MWWLCHHIVLFVPMSFVLSSRGRGRWKQIPLKVVIDKEEGAIDQKCFAGGLWGDKLVNSESGFCCRNESTAGKKSSGTSCQRSKSGLL
mmetsp:Transcript_37521/g.54939  ORF Transcript_37521/g.54939 Transcript_37521/m.54939 type:complete len:89 (+) Transcript_37521:1190-1456(+)